MTTNSRALISVVCAFSIFLSGCATTYEGPPPNFKLRGEEATKEYEKFKWDENYWIQNPRAVHMGPEKTFTVRSSLNPIINEVSPGAMSKIKHAQVWMIANGILLTGIMVWLITGISSRRDIEPGERTAYLAGIGASLGMSLFVVPYIMRDATEQFNRDLKQKFEPGVALRARF